MRRADIVSSFIIFVLGLVTILIVIPYAVPGHEGEGYALQAADFPRAVAIVFTFLSGAYCVARYFNADGKDDGDPPIATSNFGFLGLACVILIATFFLLLYAGFLVGGCFVIGVFMILMGERNPIAIIGLSVLAPLAVWGFFWKLLHFPLP